MFLRSDTTEVNPLDYLPAIRKKNFVIRSFSANLKVRKIDLLRRCANRGVCMSLAVACPNCKKANHSRHASCVGQNGCHMLKVRTPIQGWIEAR